SDPGWETGARYLKGLRSFYEISAGRSWLNFVSYEPMWGAGGTPAVPQVLIELQRVSRGPASMFIVESRELRRTVGLAQMELLLSDSIGILGRLSLPSGQSRDLGDTLLARGNLR